VAQTVGRVAAVALAEAGARRGPRPGNACGNADRHDHLPAPAQHWRSIGDRAGGNDAPSVSCHTELC